MRRFFRSDKNGLARLSNEKKKKFSWSAVRTFLSIYVYTSPILLCTVCWFMLIALSQRFIFIYFLSLLLSINQFRYRYLRIWYQFEDSERCFINVIATTAIIMKIRFRKYQVIRGQAIRSVLSTEQHYRCVLLLYAAVPCVLPL